VYKSEDIRSTRICAAYATAVKTQASPTDICNVAFGVIQDTRSRRDIHTQPTRKNRRRRIMFQQKYRVTEAPWLSAARSQSVARIEATWIGI